MVCKNNHGCGIALTGTKDKVVTSYLYGVTLNDNGDHGLGCRPYANVTITKSSSGRTKKMESIFQTVQLLQLRRQKYILMAVRELVCIQRVH